MHGVIKVISQVSVLIFVFFLALIFIFIMSETSAQEPIIRCFLEYDSFNKVFKEEITDKIDLHKTTNHYIVYFENGKVLKTEYHHFSDNEYIISYYIGTDIPNKEFIYRNLDSENSMFELFELIEYIKKNYDLNSSFLHSIQYFDDGLFKRLEMYRNGEILSYKERFYKKIDEVIYAIREEHWELSNDPLSQTEKMTKNSLGFNQKIFDGKGNELKHVWLYDEFGFYRAEDYEKASLKYYHVYYYYGDVRKNLKSLKIQLDRGDISTEEFFKEQQELFRHRTTLIKQIDDFNYNNTFNTRRFFSTLSTLMEIRYYDKNNVNRLIEYYDTNGSITAIDIKNAQGILIETYDCFEVNYEFFLEQRQKLRGE